MTTTNNIYELKTGGWLLQMTTHQSDGQILVKNLMFAKLVYAIDLANLLQLHITNIDELPLPQYKTSA